MSIKPLLKGLQHIGIPAFDLNNTIAFYEGLGFDLIHLKHVTHNENKVKAAFMQLHNLTIECYELEGKALEEIKGRSDGHIDHIAIDTDDVRAVFDYIKAGNYKILDQSIEHLKFFDHGVEFFRIEGPSGEILEFNQML